MQAIIELFEKKFEKAVFEKETLEQSIATTNSNAISYQNGRADAYADVINILTMLTELEIIIYEEEEEEEIDEEGNYV